METPKTEMPRTHAEFLASLRDAHQNGRPISYFRQWPVEYLIEAGLPDDWLEKCGLIMADGAATNLPNQCSQRQFAEIVSRLYGKATNQAAVSRAVRLEGLNVAVTPSNGRLKTDAALRWWETNKAGKDGSLIASQAEDMAARQRIAREREQLELDTIKRKFDAQWLTADAFEFFSGGFGATARNTALDLSERIQVASEGIISECVADLAQRQSLIEKLRPIYASKFDEWQIEFCQRLEDLLKQGKEMSEKQKLEMK